MIAIRRLFTFFFIILFVFSCKKSPTGSDPVVVTFPDANLETLIRETLDKPSGDIFKSELESLTELIGIELNIVDLTGMEYCVNLIYLDLSQNHITDISSIINNSGFDTGDFIDLQSNPLSDISVNTNIPQLKTRGVIVYYDEPEIVVTFPDAILEALLRETLEKPTGDITNIELANVTRIFNRNSGVTDLAGIEFCKNLSYLFLDNHNITDIAKLGALRKLKELYLYRNNIENIDILMNNLNLEYIGVSNNNISNISVLLSLPKLKWLTIGYNPITNLSIINSITNLEYISLNSLNLADLNHIANLINLTSIEIRYNQITDISVLSNLINLNRIAMNGNQVSDISAIANLQYLDDVNFNDNNITDISVFANLPNVTGIGLGNNGLTDISSLSTGLDKFEYIVISDNNISDIKALVDNTNIGDGDTIYLRNNPLSDTSKNTYIPQLEARGVTVNQ